MSTPTSSKVLLLAADPSNGARLRLLDEIREISECRTRVNGKLGPEQFELTYDGLAVQPKNLDRVMLDARPLTVVHFSGHGEGPGGLVFQGDEGTDSQLVAADALAELFRLFAGELQCVVLNACLSVAQAEQIVEHVPYVIGMSHKIGDPAAIRFARGFYNALFSGESYKRAFAFGCRAIQLGSGSGPGRKLSDGDTPPPPVPEHLKPRLYFRPDVFLRCCCDDDLVVGRELFAPLEGAGLRVGSDADFRDVRDTPYVREAALRFSRHVFVVWTPKWSGGGQADPQVDYTSRRVRTLWWSGEQPPSDVPAAAVAKFLDSRLRAQALADLLTALGLPPETASRVLTGTDSRVLVGSVKNVIDAIHPLLEAVGDPRVFNEVHASLRRTRDDIGELYRWKQLHDNLHDFTDLFPELEDSYRTLNQINAVPDDTKSVEDQERAVTAGWRRVQEAVRKRILPRFRMLEDAAKAPNFQPHEIPWFSALKVAMDMLEKACDEVHLRSLRRSVELLSPVLPQWMTTVNTVLFGTARQVPLENLVRDLGTIEQTLNQRPLPETATRVEDFRRGLTAVQALDGRLKSLILAHDCLQQIHSLTGPLDDPEVTAEEIGAGWPKVMTQRERLDPVPADDWLVQFRQRLDKVNGLIPEAVRPTADRDTRRRALSGLRNAFLDCRGQLAEGFHATDKALMRFCEELQTIRNSLTTALGSISNADHDQLVGSYVRN